MVKEREELLIIGRDLPKVEAEEKARGECKYAGDIYLPNMLYCRVLRSPHAHALVKRIDTKEAEELPGVKAVITHKDVPLLSMRGYLYIPSVMLRDNYVLTKEVRYVGDLVAAVAATTAQIAEEALELIDVEYELLPAVFDPVQAMQPDAPAVHQTVTKGDEEIPVRNNVIAPVRINLGDVEDGFKQADLVVENEFQTQGVHQTPLDCKVIVCRPLRGRRLEVWTQTQNIYASQMCMATALGLPLSKVKVHRLFIGGAFGLHQRASFVEPVCGFLALKTGLPVRAEETREEMFLAGGRHPMVMKLKTGVTKDGTIIAMHMELIDNMGAYTVSGAGMAALAGGFFMSMYRCPNVRFDGYAVYTNTPACGPMRGVGNPQVNFAIEQQMDIIAEKLDIDPVELRLKNHIRAGELFYGQGPDVVSVIRSCGTEQLMEEGAKLIGWGNRKATTPYKDQPWVKRGIGMARGFHTSGAGGLKPSKVVIDYSGAIVKINEDGTANLITACVDVGGGNLSAHAALVAEDLGLRYEDVTVTEADTDFALYDSGTHASRGVYCQGLAALAASANVKKVLLNWAARILELPADQLVVRNGRVSLNIRPEVGLSLREIVQKAQADGWGTAVGTASVRAPACPPHFTVTFVEVDVDTLTGEVKVVRAVAGADVGTPVSGHGLRGQMIGGLHMGLGYALTECMHIDPADGHLLNPSFTDYKLLTPLDMPQVQTILADTYEPTGPFGAKGIGEGATNPVASAVANAIYNAIGVRIYSLPITPEKILAAINAKEK